MPKKAKEMGPLEVSRLKTPGLWPVGGVAGLRLQVENSGARSWILRVSVAGRRPEIGLGGYPDVTLAGARDAARGMRAKIAAGINPVAERKAARSAALAASLSAVTFAEAAVDCIKAQEAGWRNTKHAKQWTSTLETYAYPVLGKMLVEDIGMDHVLRVLEPIWTTVPETASRVRMRIEKVIAFADARAKRERPNPARWKNNLDTQLAKAASVKKVRNHPALAIDAVPEFMAEVRKMQGAGARALELAILCASRSSDVRGALWSEFDLDNAMWVISAERMKAEREHRVPLAPAAVKLLRALPRVAKGKPGHELVFPAPKGGMLSDMTLAACFKRLNEQSDTPRWIDPRTGEQATPHGTARSSFKDWAAERTNFPNELSEMALAHKVANEVEAAYRRGDMFEKRRRMMSEWATFCEKAKHAKVVAIRR